MEEISWHNMAVENWLCLCFVYLDFNYNFSCFCVCKRSIL